MSNGTETEVGIVDFTGASSDMPEVGPFLLIWRPLADRLDESGDTTYALLDVFDVAVEGATAVPDSCYGAARTIAFADQAHGQVAAPTKWRLFVDRMVELAKEHKLPTCFVVRISGVQTERKRAVESMLRRFAHPHVRVIQ